MGDADGWKRGARGIDGNKGSDFLNRGKDDGNKPAHDLSLKYGSEFKGACTPWDEPTWKPGKVSSGGPPKYAPKGDAGTRDVAAASPSGKYAKKGGSGQRSGA